MNITRHNVDQLVDAGQVEVAMKNGRWWKVRRNGKTQRWKKDAERIRIPFKCGFYVYGSITETNFKADGTLNKEQFRIKEAVNETTSVEN